MLLSQFIVRLNLPLTVGGPSQRAFSPREPPPEGDSPAIPEDFIMRRLINGSSTLEDERELLETLFFRNSSDFRGPASTAPRENVIGTLEGT